MQGDSEKSRISDEHAAVYFYTIIRTIFVQLTECSLFLFLCIRERTVMLWTKLYMEEFGPGLLFGCLWSNVIGSKLGSTSLGNVSPTVHCWSFTVSDTLAGKMKTKT